MELMQNPHFAPHLGCRGEDSKPECLFIHRLRAGEGKQNTSRTNHFNRLSIDALVAAEGALIAVEHSPRDCATMEENARKFGLNNVTVVSSVDEAASLPVPGTAFLVASKYMEHEIETLIRRNPKIRLFVYTLDFRHLSAVPKIFERHGISITDAIQVGVNRLNSRGEMESEPAPWLIAGQVN